MIDAKNMTVGTYKKDPKMSEKLYCENKECGKETPMLYTVQVPPRGEDKKYCEACYKAHWLKFGYKV